MFSLCYKKEDWLPGDVCFRPPIIIKIHNLHANNIKKVVGEIASYHEGD